MRQWCFSATQGHSNWPFAASSASFVPKIFQLFDGARSQTESQFLRCLATGGCCESRDFCPLMCVLWDGRALAGASGSCSGLRRSIAERGIYLLGSLVYILLSFDFRDIILCYFSCSSFCRRLIVFTNVSSHRNLEGFRVSESYTLQPGMHKSYFLVKYRIG